MCNLFFWHWHLLHQGVQLLRASEGLGSFHLFHFASILISLGVFGCLFALCVGFLFVVLRLVFCFPFSPGYPGFREVSFSFSLI